MCIHKENKMITLILETSSSKQSYGSLSCAGEHLQGSRSQNSKVKASEARTLQSHSTQPLGV